MKYYTATEACDTFAHLIPSDRWTLSRWVKAGKFPKHDAMVKRANTTLQAWSEYTILNWQTIVKTSKTS